MKVPWVFNPLPALAGGWVVLLVPAVMGQALDVDLAGPLPPESVPCSGTFWFAQQEGQPPLPINPFPELAVYAMGTNGFLVDDRTVDYVQLHAGRRSQPPVGLASRVSTMATASGAPPPSPTDPGTGGDDSPVSVAAFQLDGQMGFLNPAWIGTNALGLDLTNGGANDVFDLYYTTNLSANVALPELSLTNWVWLLRGDPGQTRFTVANLMFQQCYFRLGTLFDQDNDGIPDAYEHLVSHTPVNQFTFLSRDGHGTPDAWYLLHGLVPMDDSADPDGDGVSNALAYRTGMNPKSGAAFQVWVGTPAAGGLP